MQVPQFWRGPDDRLYRIKRDCRPLEGKLGRRYIVRAFAIGQTATAAAEASVTLSEADLREAIRLRHQTPTPEQLFAEAFQAVMSLLGSG